MAVDAGMVWNHMNNHYPIIFDDLGIRKNKFPRNLSERETKVINLYSESEITKSMPDNNYYII